MRKLLKRRLLMLLACLPIALALCGVAGADQPAFETGLDPTGVAYEVNRDADGDFWISDFDTGRIWHVSPRSDAYEVYAVLGAPSDARQVAGWLWWVDGETGIVGRASTIDGATTRWTVPGATGFFGTAVDSAGRLWTTGSNSPLLYRLDATAGELCTFTLPDQGVSDYVVMAGADLWLADVVNGRLLRLRLGNNELTSWSLPVGSTPLGLAVDAHGDVWYADQRRNAVARLDAESGHLFTYTLPLAGVPAMVAVEGGNVWYTLQSAARIGHLDVAVATGADTVANPVQGHLAPSCAPIAPASTGHVTITVGELGWTPSAYASTSYPNGFEVFSMPEGAAGWGLALEAGDLWVVDQGRQQLVRLPSVGTPGTRIYLPVCLSP